MDTIPSHETDPAADRTAGKAPEPIDIRQVRAFLRRKDERRQAVLDRQFDQAWKDFNAIVEHLVAHYAPRRIWQWGSLLDRKKFSEISDIDIAIEGLSGPQAYFEVLGTAQKLTEFPLDILEMQSIGKENADYIRTIGRLVYER